MGREREMNMYRSGSAPPTVEGSLSAVVGLPEDELRSDPAYISYYYSNVNLNPRLPPPLLPKEDWRRESGCRTQGNGVGVEREDASLFSLGFGETSESNVGQWGEDGLIGLPGLGIGSKHKSFSEVIQDDVTYGTPLPNHPSRPASRNVFENGVESDSHFGNLKMVQRNVIPSSQTYASALGASLSRSTTPDPQLSHRTPSPRIPPVGDGRSTNILRTEPADVAAALSAMTFSTNIPNMVDDSQNLFHLQADKNPIKQQQERSDSNMHSVLNMYLNGPSTPVQNGRGNLTSTYNKIERPNSSFLNYGYNGYAISPTSPSMMENQTVNLRPLFENMSLIDPISLQYMRGNDPMMDYDVNSYMELLNLQNNYLGQALSPNNSQYGVPYFGKSVTMNNNYYGNSTLGIDMAYPVSPLGRSFSPTSPFRERSMLYPSQLRSFGTRGMGSWQNMDGHFASTLLDEFKSNKTRCFELSEIAGHIVEFSADQYGSRFIQQKLETATLDEINMVFNEINPQALTLMTDVFGNYVIQKFFEHGTPAQIREFANHLIGNVLTLSLQMYGCRVIQKAIEVVELDQQTKMVAELDGHVMRCVRDQNGNHVIQKCIECVPEEVIQFIISVFYNQVVTLSTHPYGCRVIQRVLEHCADPKTLKVMMDEIMQSVVMLAQDQYGNYVVQHVLEHGQPHERTAILKQLIGQIVQMSQQKFASNVVEKCLSFGTPEERQILVDEMLGSTNENDPLQVMMKDQFANYVVQKVLETCDDQQLTLILNRIKVHLTALKKYTYGKHIVARVEKLVTAGEKRISTMAATYSA